MVQLLGTSSFSNFKMRPIIWNYPLHNNQIYKIVEISPRNGKELLAHKFVFCIQTDAQIIIRLSSMLNISWLLLLFCVSVCFNSLLLVFFSVSKYFNRKIRLPRYDLMPLKFSFCHFSSLSFSLQFVSLTLSLTRVHFVEHFKMRKTQLILKYGKTSSRTHTHSLFLSGCSQQALEIQMFPPYRNTWFRCKLYDVWSNFSVNVYFIFLYYFFFTLCFASLHCRTSQYEYKEA